MRDRRIAWVFLFVAGLGACGGGEARDPLASTDGRKILRVAYDREVDVPFRKDIARLFEVQLEEQPYFLESEYTPSGSLIDWAKAKGGIS